MSFERFGTPKEQHRNGGELHNPSRRGFLFGKRKVEEGSRQVPTKQAAAPVASVQESQSEEPEKKASDMTIPRVSRRDFMTMMAMIPVGIALGRGTAIVLEDGLLATKDNVRHVAEGVTQGRLAEYVTDWQQENEQYTSLETELAVLKDAFEKRYSISLVFEENPHMSEGKSVSSERASLLSRVEGMRILWSEFDAYPFFLIRDLHIPSINLRRNVTMQTQSGKQERIGGAANNDDHSLIWDTNDGMLDYLLFGRAGGKYLLKRAIHHELYHCTDPCVDIREDEAVERIRREKSVEWIALNQDGEGVYTQGTDQQVARGEDFRGFARPDGMRNIREDRATVWEGIMSGDFSEDLLEGDPVLKSKVGQIKRDMFLLSRGLMDSDFFGSRSSVGIVYDRVARMKRIMTTDRKAMAISDPLFASVSDEQYLSWQEYYHSMLG